MPPVGASSCFMNRTRIIALVAGVAVLAFLFRHIGWASVVPLLGDLGWRCVWIALYYVIPIAFAAQAWRVLFSKSHDPGFGRIFYASWIGLACNWLLPVAQVGGEVAKAQLIAPPQKSIEPWATMVVDKTFQVMTQICFAMLGLSMLMMHRFEKTILLGGGLALLALVVIGTLLVRSQKRGLFSMSTRLLQKVVKHGDKEVLGRVAAEIDKRVRVLYRSPKSLAGAFCWRMGFRLGMAGEVYLIFYLMGHPIDYTEAMILESLGQTIRMAAFLIPGGLGAQEGTLTLIGTSLGIPASHGLALSLARRVRELLVGLPALGLWAAGLWQSRRSRL
jgi:putative membrane protein